MSDHPVTPGSEEWRQRVQKILAEERAKPPGWFYLSFADDDDDGFLGGVFIFAHGITDAVLKTKAMGLNPGGEVLAMSANEPPPQFKNRLLTKEEIQSMDPVQ